MSKSLHQISMDFGMEPVQESVPVQEDVVVITAKDEVLILPQTIKKKPGRKKKEKSWMPTTPGKRGRKSLKEMAAEADLITVPDDEILFQKHYYSMGDVANMFRVNHSLIRFWANDFDKFLNPKKNGKGDRFFRPEDVKTLHLIYHLLRQRKYTIEGAKDYLKNQKKAATRQFEMLQSLQKLRSFLLELKANI